MTEQALAAHGLTARAEQILAELQAFRALDAPTHGGRVLSYVYDSGLGELDELAGRAAQIMQPVNGLDPTTFPSVAALERAVVSFARTVLHGDDDVVGSVTSGGTESCLLAVKTARDIVRARQASAAGGAAGDAAQRRLRIVAPATVHAAFHKAAEYFDLVLDLVPVDAHTGAVRAQDVIARLTRGTGDPGAAADVALVVVSAPAYPHGGLDPVAEVAGAAAALGVACHVDACFGGWVLPWWEGELPPWDFEVAGVTSISADLHKYGYAPKGVSVLLHRGRGWLLQQQPGFTQADGSRIPHTTHLTVTPVSESVLDDDAGADGDAVGGSGLLAALRTAADDVRGLPGIDGVALAATLDPEQKLLGAGGELDRASLPELLARLGLSEAGTAGMPQDMAPLMALIEVLPGSLVEALLTELLASLVAPVAY